MSLKKILKLKATERNIEESVLNYCIENDQETFLFLTVIPLKQFKIKKRLLERWGELDEVKGDTMKLWLDDYMKRTSILEDELPLSSKMGSRRPTFKMEVTDELIMLSKRLSRRRELITEEDIEKAQSHINLHNLPLTVDLLFSLSQPRCLIALRSGYVNPLFVFEGYKQKNVIKALLFQREMEIKATNDRSLEFAHSASLNKEKFEIFLNDFKRAQQQYIALNVNERERFLIQKFLIGNIQGFLEPKEKLTQLNLVSSEWNQAKAEWGKIDLHHLQAEVDDEVSFKIISLSQKGSVREVDFSGTVITDASVVALAAFSNLESLNISECNYVTSQSLSALSELEKLTTLYYDDAGSDLDGVSQLQNLESLHLKNNVLPNRDFILSRGVKDLRINRSKSEGVEFLKPLKLLETLDMSYYTLTGQNRVLEIRNESLKTLFLKSCNMIKLEGFSSLISLKELYLSNCKNLNSVEFPNLSEVPLEKINLSSNIWVDINVISKLPLTLKYIRLSSCINITDECLELISRLRSVVSLELSKCRLLTRVGIDYISTLPLLKYLDIGRCNFHDDGKVEEIGFHNLERLSTNDMEGNQSLFERFCRINSLKMFFFDSWVKDMGSIMLLENLTILNISDREMKDEDLFYISTLINLKELALYYCDGVTSTGFKNLGSLINLEQISLNNGLQEPKYPYDVLPLSVLGNMSKLKSLELFGYSIYYEDINNLLALKELRDLSLNSCNVDDQIFMAITDIHSLTDLEIDNNEVTDCIFKYILKLKNLTYISVKDSKDLCEGTIKEVLDGNGILYSY